MAYSTSSPPAMVTQRVGGGGAFWIYDSADTALTINTAGYITNADDLGMKVGDLVFHTDTAGATVATIFVVNSVTAGGAGDLTDGTTISVADLD